jgi:cytosine/uracil/thiamine/allantoin permease
MTTTITIIITTTTTNIVINTVSPQLDIWAFLHLQA